MGNIINFKPRHHKLRMYLTLVAIVVIAAEAAYLAFAIKDYYVADTDLKHVQLSAPDISKLQNELEDTQNNVIANHDLLAALDEARQGIALMDILNAFNKQSANISLLTVTTSVAEESKVKAAGPEPEQAAVKKLKYAIKIVGYGKTLDDVTQFIKTFEDTLNMGIDVQSIQPLSLDSREYVGFQLAIETAGGEKQ